ncbi:MAG: nicotinate (nicotinamide) nucleotide adenylyltransferase [Candidatus Omnitrophica bacterium]|nr:nicotinate (nicotinamide) nucleotide adenylyltransferase [Candidatus Omnitrophota bacterium]
MKFRKREIRIGILGGTFDPVHNAHLKLARAAHRVLKLDQLIFVPANISPFKRNQRVASARDRLKMLKIALKNFPWARISDVEMKRKGISYSIRTMRYFRKKLGKEARLFIVLGADAFETFPKWKDAKKILQLAQIAMAARPGFMGKLFELSYIPIPMKKMAISSSEIRKRLSTSETGSRYVEEVPVPPAVLRYILKKEIYS